MKDDRKQTDHHKFKSDFNNCEMKIQTEDRMDEKLEIANNRSMENDQTNLTFVDLNVH